MYFNKVRKNKYMRKICAGLLMAGMLVISGKVDCGAIDTQNINQFTPAATTCYDYLEWTLWTYRYKIVSSKKDSTAEFGHYSTIATLNNDTKRDQVMTHEVSQTVSATITLGKKVKKKYLEKEIGGAVTYARTETTNLKTTVPPKSKVALKKRTKTVTTNYNSKFQKQHFLIIDQSWNNEGSPFKKVSERKEKFTDYKWE